MEAAANPTNKRSGHPSAIVKSRQPDAECNEKRKRINCEHKDQPAEQADPGDIENKSKCEHGGGSVQRRHGCAFHHHHGAIKVYCKRDEDATLDALDAEMCNSRPGA
jgi:hypothetical protein